MSCSCAKDAPHSLCEFDATQTWNSPPKHCLQHMLLGYVSASPEAMLKGRQFRNKNQNSMYIFELKTGGKDGFLGCELNKGVGDRGTISVLLLAWNKSDR